MIEAYREEAGKAYTAREEELTWAYFRPAAVIECRGGLRSDGSLVSWEFTTINAGGAAIGAIIDHDDFRC